MKSTQSIKFLGTLAIALAFLVMPFIAQADDNRPMSGSLWSDTIGWTLFNSYAGNSQFEMVEGGSVEGWGWSDTIGWLKFDPTTMGGIRGGGDNYGARFNLNTYPATFTGWARYCSGTINKDCVSASRTDGWDGWLKFSNVSVSTTTSASETTYTTNGFAWGGPVIGWVDVKLLTSAPIEPEEEECDPETDPDECEGDPNGGSGNVGCYITTGDTEIPPDTLYGFAWSSTGGATECESEDFVIDEGETEGSHIDAWPVAGVQVEKEYRITCYKGSQSGSCEVTFEEGSEDEGGELSVDLYVKTLASQGGDVTATYGQKQGVLNPIGPFSIRLGTNVEFVWSTVGAERCNAVGDSFFQTNELANGVTQYKIVDDVDINIGVRCRNAEGSEVSDNLIIQVTDPVFREF